MAKKHKPFNGITIPLDTQRSIILENDKLYAKDVEGLAASSAAGLVTDVKSVQQWQMQAALRRAHVPHKLAKRMMNVK